MNTSYDTLTITINADSSQAIADIGKLSTSLNRLNKSAQNLDVKKVNEVKKLLQGIAKIDFTNVSKGLQDVVKAFNAFQSKKFMNATNNGSDLSGSLKDQEEAYTPNWEAMSWAYSNDTSLMVIKDLQQQVAVLNQDVISCGKSFQETIEDIDKQLPSTILHFRELKEEVIDLEDALSGAGFNPDQIKSVMSAIHSELKKINPAQLKELKKILMQFGASAKQASNIVRKLAKDNDLLGNKGVNAFKKLANQFKNIMKYRIIRKIIQEIYKALTEGVKNVIAFDSATNEAVEKLKAGYEFLKNSIGSVIAPIIQMVTPMLTMIMSLLGGINNQIAEIFASANGQTTFAKAKEDLEGFNEEAKKTKALGIDELNVLQDEGASDLFTTEQVNLGEKEQKIADSIKKLFGEIKKIIEKIKPIINDLIDKVLPAIGNFIEPIVDTISTILDLLSILVEATFSDVNTSLADFVFMLGSINGFINNITNVLSTILVPVLHIISPILNIINSVLSGVFKIIGGILDALSPILRIVQVLLVPVTALLTCVSTIFYVIEGIVKTIIKIITLDWFTIGDTWKDVGNKIKKAWEDMADVAQKSWDGTQSYATGGFPEDGLFFANHNELVGQFTNGQTAVANNQQITQGIYEAVRDAMKESGGQGDISIQIDGQELAKIITKKQNNFGADLIVGGNLNYGK